MPKPAAKKTKNKSAKALTIPVARPRGDETRTRLLEAAHDQFLHNGFHGASMRQIARAAGMAVGGIYNHFESKEDIFVAVLDEHHPYHVLLPALADTQGETLEAFVLDAGRRVEAAVKGAENRLLPLISIELVEFQGRHIKDLAQRIFPSMLGFAQKFGERGGQLRDLPLPVVLRTFISLMIGYTITEAILKNTPMFKAMDYNWYGNMVDIYLRGILEPGAAPAEA